MTKMIKMSLVTAIAIAGLSTNVSAKVLLEDAIKDVTLKGYVSYTMEKYTDKDGKDDEAQHDIDVRVQADWKVSDKYSATVRIDENNDDDTDENPNDADSTTKDSSSLQPEIDQVYITYKNSGLKVTTGMQKVLAPRLHDSINGDGVKFAYKMNDALTLGGGYFYTTEKTNTDEVLGLALTGNTDMFTYGLTYASIVDSDDKDNDGSVGDNGATVVDVLGSIKLGSMSLNLAHTVRSDDTEVGGIQEKDQKLSVVGLSGKVDSFKYGISYAKVGKDGAEVAIDKDGDADVNLVLDAVSTDALKDANALYMMADVKFADTMSAKLEYVTADSDSKSATDIKDADEFMITLSNKVTKKLKLFAKYNAWETKLVDGTSDEDRTKVTLGAKYSF